MILDLDATGDVYQLAPYGWGRNPLNRKGKAYDPYAMKLFEMIPGDMGRWEWVTQKAGILMHGKTMPTTASGKNLFGNFTWGKIWKHGYEPMATLDRDKDGFLRGGELAELWVWRDADADAVLDPGEVKPASEVVMSLAVVPTLHRGTNSSVSTELVKSDTKPSTVNSTSDPDYFAPQGAQLVGRMATKDGVDANIPHGKWVSTWDWWSRGMLRSNPKESTPQADQDAVCMYRWKQTNLLPGQPESARMSGYFRFGKIQNQIVVASVSDQVPSPLIGLVGKVDLVTHGRLQWCLAPQFPLVAKSRKEFGPQFYEKSSSEDGRGSSFAIYSRAMYRNEKLYGASTTVGGFGFAWIAEPVTSYTLPVESSLGTVDFSELGDGVNAGKFFFQPVRVENAAKPLAFLSFSEMLDFPDL